MDAMAVTGAVVHMPIFHPLIGMDKEEIVTIARRIGTMETSILPYEDCCTVFTPKHPKTKPSLATGRGGGGQARRCGPDRPRVKKRLLGVSDETLRAYTAVSRQTATEMAKGAREAVCADVGVSVTGLAGPDGDGTGRPIGLVYIGLDMNGFSLQSGAASGRKPRTDPRGCGAGDFRDAADVSVSAGQSRMHISGRNGSAACGETGETADGN